jgi:LmbE family N-acetylglucosaminyl deacetylase
MLRLLCVTAHPDDEAGAFGGALALYSSRGVETYVLCLTAGEAASNRGNTRSDEELTATRRAEFAEACRILKVERGEVLSYPDRGLYCAEPFPAARDLARRVRQIRPQVMITFGPEGSFTGHPDHGMAGIFASLAFHWAARTDIFPPEEDAPVHRAQKLYYITGTLTLPGRQAISLPPSTAVIDVGQFVETKIAAFRAHRSQGPLSPQFERFVRGQIAEERYHLAACLTPRSCTHETDLFAGVLDND